MGCPYWCPYFRKASLILGASVFFFWVSVQPFCRKPWKLDCNILQQRFCHSDCNDRSFIPVPELFGSWLQAVGRVKKNTTAARERGHAVMPLQKLSDATQGPKESRGCTEKSLAIFGLSLDEFDLLREFDGFMKPVAN